MGLFRPTNTWRISVFRALRFHQSASVSSALCFPHCFPSLYGFLPWSAWVPLPLGRPDLRSSTTSLRLGPLSSVSLGPVSVLRFSSASELYSRLFRASLATRFHPCDALALSHDLLFSLWGIWLPVPRTALRPCFPLRSSAPLWVLCTMEVGFPSVARSGPPSMRFFPSTLSSNSSRSRSRLIVSPKGLWSVTSSAPASIKTVVAVLRITTLWSLRFFGFVWFVFQRAVFVQQGGLSHFYILKSTTF